MSLQDSLLVITWAVTTFLGPAHGSSPLTEDTKEATSRHNPNPCERSHP